MIEALSPSTLVAAQDDLVNLLRDCVHHGASLGFLAPLPESDTIDYWRAVAPQIAAGSRTVIVARDDDGRVVGSGQLAYESKPNGRHRAEINKVMVLPSQRRHGIAAEIMRALEQCARERNIRLLVLDTAEGAGGAQRFYESLGYIYAGGIPDYALDPDGRAMKNAIYYKLLA